MTASSAHMARQRLFFLYPVTAFQILHVAHQRLFDVARNVLDAYQQQITPFEGGDVLLPGIIAVHLPGHTPGHSGYLLESEDDSLLIWGDVLHFPHIQVARPDVTFAFDHNPGLAAKTRRKILTELSPQ
ncbi:MAG: MBL fold metallo-hydrolase [Acetobacter fabarum]|nr:MBL fold metallo-hydrolase [Acetobacter fabarum]